MNEVRLDGILVERAAVRRTPAGVAVVEAQIRHRSEVMEAGASRTLEFLVNAIALGPIAGSLEREALGAPALELLQRHLGGAAGLALRNQEIAGVTVLDLDDIAELAEIGQLLEQDHLHLQAPESASVAIAQ